MFTLCLTACSTGKTDTPTETKGGIINGNTEFTPNSTGYNVDSKADLTELIKDLSDDYLNLIELSGGLSHYTAENPIKKGELTQSYCDMIKQSYQTPIQENKEYLSAASKRIEELGKIQINDEDDDIRRKKTYAMFKELMRTINFIKNNDVSNCEAFAEKYQQEIADHTLPQSIIEANFKAAKELGVISRDYTGYNR